MNTSDHCFTVLFRWCRIKHSFEKMQTKKKVVPIGHSCAGLSFPVTDGLCDVPAAGREHFTAR